MHLWEPRKNSWGPFTICHGPLKSQKPKAFPIHISNWRGRNVGDECFHQGKRPVNLMWSSVGRRPYLLTAALAALKPPPYAGEVSLAIWCMKNLPSFFSASDFPPFLEDVEDEEAADVDGALLYSGMTSDSSHMYDKTWHMPSSTSGLRLR